MNMTVHTPLRNISNVGAFDRVANVSFKESKQQQSVRSNIRVVVRVRPENEYELSGGHSTVIRVLDERLLIFDPKEDEAPDFYHGRQRQCRDFSKRKNRDMRFAFDYVFDTDATNVDLYNNTTKGILDSLLDGYNCSVFAYGATGAGKTYSMKGTRKSPGVMFLTMMDLYHRIELIKEEKTCDVAVSYLEVYNEQIRDLLNPTDYLPVREDPSKGTIVAGLSLHKPRTAEELLHMLDFGNKNRTQHPTDANTESSRSHAVFQVFVRQKERTANVSADVSVAKMSLIDLAGSERATVTKNCGVRFREGANINRSLLALGNCINALAEGKSKGYVPYRNSKLTRLLKDSLGGNCRTVMIAAVSPSGKSYEDTYNTLKYADRAKNIKADLKRNVVSVDYHISHYVKMIEDLRTEVEEYKVKVKCFEEGVVINSKTPFDSPYQSEIEKLQAVLFSVFHDRMNIRKEIMELEGSERDLSFRVHLKEKSLERIGLVYSDPTITEKVTSKIQRSIYSSKKRQVNIVSRKTESHTRMDSNVKELQRVENEMKLVSNNGVTPEILELTLRTRHLEVELRDTKRQVKYLKKLCRAQEREAQATERLIKTLLEGFKKQYLLLKADSLVTSDIDADYDTIRQMLYGEREVAWADQSMPEGRLGSGDRMGDTKRNLSESEFDINPLLEFPVMACVNTTPKTPNNKTHPRTPGSAMSVAMTPCTPGTYKKGRFTPRRQSMPVFMMTPTTPRLCGSHQLLNTTVGSASKSYMTPNKNSQEEEIGIPKSVSLNSIDENCEVITGSATVTKNPCTSYLLNNNMRSGKHLLHEGHSNYIQSNNNASHLYAPNTPRNVSSGTKLDDRMLNETFTKIDGIEPLLDSPLPNKEQLSGQQIQRNNEMSAKLTENVSDKYQNGQWSQSHSNVPIRKCLDILVNNKDSVNSINVANQHSYHRPLPNYNTVTKSKPEVIQQSSGSNQEKLAMMNVTVTKNKPSIMNENEVFSPPPHDKRLSVVRSMTFDNMPSPAGKLTFAEVLKSPAVKSLQQTGIAPLSPRSPLCSVENLPSYKQSNGKSNSHHSFKNCKLGYIPKLSLSDEKVNAKDKSALRSDKTLSELQRYGLPSVRERAHSASRVPVNKPLSSKGYLRTTTAVISRNNIYKNPNDDGKPFIGSAKRVKKEESRKIPKATGVRRTQSMNYGTVPKWNNRF